MLTMKAVRSQFRRRAATRLATRAVNRDSVLAACRAMRVLNFYAKEQSLWKAAIYEAKNELVRHLYATRPGPVVQHTKTRLCLGFYDPVAGFLGCDGTHCRKCDGSGTYTLKSLLLFCFEVEGESFYWHMAADDVTWAVQAAAAMPLHPRSTPFAYVTPTQREADVLLATVTIYLERCGITLRGLNRIGVWDAMMADVTKWTLRMRGAASPKHQVERP